MQLVIPMAGLGQRFRDAGYTMPKPLIPVAGVPMVARVVAALPRAERAIFVCHREHVERHGIDQQMRELVPGCHMVIAPGLTQGQACSVRLGAEYLDLDTPVLAAACDSTQVYDEPRFRALTRDPAIDAIVWTYRHEPRVLVRPHWYGWVRERSGLVEAVSVKEPLSTEPLEDHVISGTFWFRTAGLMLAGIDRLIALERCVNGEFYLDSVAGVLLETGHRVAVFEMDKYIGWGTPDDLADYERWHRHFAAMRAA